MDVEEMAIQNSKEKLIYKLKTMNNLIIIDHFLMNSESGFNKFHTSVNLVKEYFGEYRKDCPLNFRSLNLYSKIDLMSEYQNIVIFGWACGYVSEFYKYFIWFSNKEDYCLFKLIKP